MSPKLRKVSIVVDGSYCRQISFNQEQKVCYPSFSSSSTTRKRTITKNHADLSYSSEETLESDEESSIRTRIWNRKDDAILQAAIETIGFDWDIISNLWFNTNKSEEQCYIRAMQLELKTMKVPNRHGFNYYRKRPSPSMKHVSNRRRRELEALEERRLFGKTRCDFENQIIHCAYLVGYSKLEKLLRMNGIEVEDDEVEISFSSLMVEMQALDKADVRDSIVSASKSIQKLPKAIKELPDAQVLSPQRYPTHSNKANQRTTHEQCQRKDTRRFINFKSTELPIESSLMDAIEILNPSNRKEEPTLQDLDLEKESSPKMNYPFPCLPFTPPKIKPSAIPKTYFMFRSTTRRTGGAVDTAGGGVSSKKRSTSD